MNVKAQAKRARKGKDKAPTRKRLVQVKASGFTVATKAQQRLKCTLRFKRFTVKSVLQRKNSQNVSISVSQG